MISHSPWAVGTMKWVHAWDMLRAMAAHRRSVQVWKFILSSLLLYSFIIIIILLLPAEGSSSSLFSLRYHHHYYFFLFLSLLLLLLLLYTIITIPTTEWPSESWSPRPALNPKGRCRWGIKDTLAPKWIFLIESKAMLQRTITRITPDFLIYSYT